MKPQDLHTHSVYDDGGATLEQMVRSAFFKKLSAVGLSVHSPIEGETWTISTSDLKEFLQEADRLKTEYHSRITVFCGVEYDLRSELDLSVFDYVIGSLHATQTPDGAFDTDNTAQIAWQGIDRFFGGDADAAAEAYFAQYQAMAKNPEIDIVGHFDLLTKFDEQGRLYDETSSRYLEAAYSAMRTLAEAGKIFEINSGAISRGYRSTPYPAKHLLEYLCGIGGKICLTSDAHRKKDVGFAFAQSLEIAKSCGFNEIWYLKEQGFTPVPINRIEV